MHDVPPYPSYQLFVGVYIAGVTATVAWQASQQKPGKPITIEQTLEGFSSLHQRLMKTGARPDQILMVPEAMGCIGSLWPLFSRALAMLSVW